MNTLHIPFLYREISAKTFNVGEPLEVPPVDVVTSFTVTRRRVSPGEWWVRFDIPEELKNIISLSPTQLRMIADWAEELG